MIECSWNKTTLNTYTLHCVQCERRVHSGFLASWLLVFWSCDLMSSFCHHLCVASSPPELHRSAAHLPNSNGSSVVSLRNNTADVSLFKSQRISLKGPFIPKIKNAFIQILSVRFGDTSLRLVCFLSSIVELHGTKKYIWLNSCVSFQKSWPGCSR